MSSLKEVLTFGFDLVKKLREHVRLKQHSRTSTRLVVLQINIFYLVNIDFGAHSVNVIFLGNKEGMR